MKQYLDLAKHIMSTGTDKEDRTGTGTRSIFGHQMRFDLSEGFPCMTTKKLHLKSIIHELIWFLSGDTNVKYLKDNGVRIWDEWADEKGDLGPVYGYQWRSWPTPDGGHIDQISKVVDQIKNSPDSRRIIVSGWNVPFNIASYALLTMMMAQVCELQPGDFVHTFGDVHIYKNHFEQINLQLSREPKALPKMRINPEVKDIFSFKFEDFELTDYDPHPHIKGVVAV